MHPHLIAQKVTAAENVSSETSFLIIGIIFSATIGYCVIRRVCNGEIELWFEQQEPFTQARNVLENVTIWWKGNVELPSVSVQYTTRTVMERGADGLVQSSEVKDRHIIEWLFTQGMNWTGIESIPLPYTSITKLRCIHDFLMNDTEYVLLAHPRFVFQVTDSLNINTKLRNIVANGSLPWLYHNYTEHGMYAAMQQLLSHTSYEYVQALFASLPQTAIVPLIFGLVKVLNAFTYHTVDGASHTHYQITEGRYGVKYNNLYRIYSWFMTELNINFYKLFVYFHSQLRDNTWRAVEPALEQGLAISRFWLKDLNIVDTLRKYPDLDRLVQWRTQLMTRNRDYRN